jgi:cytochrome c peroxidase
MVRAWSAIALVCFGAACVSDAAPSTPASDDAGTVESGVADAAELAHLRAELGRFLFYDPILSIDGETACATCHSEHWGMGDGLPRAIGAFGGTLSGPGREGENVGPRNTPTLWNAAERSALLWDGRAASLEEQALLPFEIEAELALPVDDALDALRTVPEYEALFAAAFPDEQAPIARAPLAQALAAFVRTLVSDRAPYDAYVAGDRGALRDTTREGLALFEALECGSCHTPPLFQSDRYAARGLVEGDLRADLGRFTVTDDEADRGAFRVPTLRNVATTEPYFHDGRAATLREAVEHEVAQQARVVSASELDALTEFLAKGLLDISRNPDRPERVPSGLPLPRDGFRIPR